MVATESEPSLVVDQRGSVRWLWLNRPSQRNALNTDLIDALIAQVTSAERDAGTAVVAVAGHGPSFCAGADLRHLLTLHENSLGTTEFLSKVSDCFSGIEASTVPWVAVIHGHAIAGGLELALACDVVVAADSALIGDGHVNNRLVPAGGSSVRLPRAVGHSLARWLLLTGQLVSPNVLADAGWIHAVVPKADLQAAAAHVCGVLADRAGPTQTGLKVFLNSIDGLKPREALASELIAFDDNWTGSDTPTALRAFLDARSSSTGSIHAI